MRIKNTLAKKKWNQNKIGGVKKKNLGVKIMQISLFVFAKVIWYIVQYMC